MEPLKLFMILLGCKPEGRHTEQHDFFFGIAPQLKDLFQEIRDFWPDSGRIHIDGWREVNTVENYQVKISPKGEPAVQGPKLFFINLGGYLPNRFEEQHYVVLTVKDDYASAMREAKSTAFFEHNRFEGANSHIDDKYGIDVDDIYQIEDILNPAQKAQYQIELIAAENLVADELHLGYLKLSQLM